MDEESVSLGGLLATLKRRKWWFVLPFLLVLAGAIGIAYSLPAVYRSSGKILIEQQEIPADLVRSTVSGYADQRIAQIKQRVMTAANLATTKKRVGAPPPNLLATARRQTAALQSPARVCRLLV